MESKRNRSHDILHAAFSKMRILHWRYRWMQTINKCNDQNNDNLSLSYFGIVVQYVLVRDTLKGPTLKSHQKGH